MMTENFYKIKVFQLLLINSLLFSSIFTSCNSESTEKENVEVSSIDETADHLLENDSSETEVNLIDESYSYQTTLDLDKGWGYQILKGKKVYINQPHIPAISGNEGFSSEENAIKTAKFALYKIENGIMPPTLSKSELDSLGVLSDK